MPNWKLTEETRQFNFESRSEQEIAKYLGRDKIITWFNQQYVAKVDHMIGAYKVKFFIHN